MADPNMTSNNNNNSNETMQREQARTEVGGGGGDRQREQNKMDNDSHNRSAIGGQSKSDETAKDKNQSDFDTKRSGEPTSQR